MAAAAATGCSAPTGPQGDLQAPQQVQQQAPAPPPAPAAGSAGGLPALSQSPVADALYRCLTARGWQVTLSDDGGIEASSENIPQQQYQLYLSDTWACNKQVAAQFPVDDNQKHLLYAAELAERKCLQQHGYQVADPPSLQQFLDEYDTAPWSAMATSELATLAQTMPDAEWKAINQQCPQPVPGTLH